MRFKRITAWNAGSSPGSAPASTAGYDCDCGAAASEGLGIGAVQPPKTDDEGVSNIARPCWNSFLASVDVGFHDMGGALARLGR